MNRKKLLWLLPILYTLIIFVQYYFFLLPYFSVEEPETLKFLNIACPWVLIAGVIFLVYVAKYGLIFLLPGFSFGDWKKKLKPEEYKTIRIAYGELILIQMILFGIVGILLMQFGLPDPIPGGTYYGIPPEMYLFPIGIIIAGIIQYLWTKKKFG